MTTNIKSISAAEWFPLSATYEHDDNISLSPDEQLWSDGYTTFHHNIFERNKDVAINRNTSLYLSPSGSFFDFFEELSNDPTNLGCYITMGIGSNYVGVFEDEIYVDEIKNLETIYFRLYLNSDNTISLKYNEFYFTVNNYNFQIELSSEISETNRQRFNYKVKNDTIKLTAKYENPHYPFGPQYIERFVSYDTNDKLLKAIGIVEDDDYALENTMLFNITGYDPYYTADGLTKDQVWVRYYNDLENKNESLGTTPYDQYCVSAVKINRLVDCPNMTKIDVDTQQMKINIANLKNVYTSDYYYRVKPQD